MEESIPLVAPTAMVDNRDIDKTVEPVPAPKHPFVFLLIVNSDGKPMNLFGGENPPLAKVLSRAAMTAEANGWKIQKVNTSLGQDIYEVSRELAKDWATTFVEKRWQEIQDLFQDMPETASYYFVVVY